MTSRALVDPELLGMLDSVTVAELTREVLEPARAYMDSLTEPLDAYARSDVLVERRSIPPTDRTREVTITLYRPRAATRPLPTYLSIHGGGYVMGTSAFNGRSNVALAAALGCLVVAVDYRLAPEAPAPAAVEDCYAALAWIHENAQELGVDRTRVAVGGDSAGGGLAAALSLLARDRARYPICFQLLIYPMLDDRSAVAGTRANSHVGEFIWTQRNNWFGWEAYLGKDPGSPGIPAYHAAARAQSLAGLPPACVYVGALDLFLEEDVAYVMRLLAAGVPAELHVYPGAFHGFDRALGSRIATIATSDAQRALERAFATQR
jgi:acetyl esterase/lipase